MQTTRAARVAQELQQEIATIIHQELKDPRLGFVTITKVALSKDCRYAKAFFSCLGGAAERRRSQEALDCSIGFIHGLIRKRFRLKVIPALTFHYDASIELSLTMSKMLDQLHERPNAPGPAAASS